MSTLWQVRCMENQFPGMWQRWFKHQCVAVGWPSGERYKLHEDPAYDKNWSETRSLLKTVQSGDYVVALLHGRRVGRLGEVTGKAIEDNEWDPLVPTGTKDFPHGEMGRRIFVRWDLKTGPDSVDQVVKLPSEFRFNYRKAISRVTRSLDELREVMNDPSNWEGLLGRFSNEKALSDYIASYPHRLEDGLLPYPNAKIREKVFPDRSRLDVLLVDRTGKPVVVECKQHSPTDDDVKQLRHYLKALESETGESARGILVHGGAGNLKEEVRKSAEEEPRVALLRYRLDVDFLPSS